MNDKLAREDETQAPILPVPRTKEEAKRLYDRISKFYDYLTASSERKYAEKALDRLSIEEGETVLEIGFGTGYCLKRIAERVGQTVKAYGVDYLVWYVGSDKEKIGKNQSSSLFWLSQTCRILL